MAKITKKAKLIAAKVNAEQKYEVAEAVKLVKEFATAKFDETIEIAFNLNLDPTKAEQQLRGAIVLPHGTGKTSKILVFAEGDAATAATEVVPESVPLPEAIDATTLLVNDVTVLSPESVTLTTGWVVKADPLTAPAGWVVIMALVADPTWKVKVAVALVVEA